MFVFSTLIWINYISASGLFVLKLVECSNCVIELYHFLDYLYSIDLLVEKEIILVLSITIEFILVYFYVVHFHSGIMAENIKPI